MTTKRQVHERRRTVHAKPKGTLMHNTGKDTQGQTLSKRAGSPGRKSAEPLTCTEGQVEELLSEGESTESD
jgi:hypothetical protein